MPARGLRRSRPFGVPCAARHRGRLRNSPSSLRPLRGLALRSSNSARRLPPRWLRCSAASKSAPRGHPHLDVKTRRGVRRRRALIAVGAFRARSSSGRTARTESHVRLEVVVHHRRCFTSRRRPACAADFEAAEQRSRGGGSRRALFELRAASPEGAPRRGRVAQPPASASSAGDPEGAASSEAAHAGRRLDVPLDLPNEDAHPIAVSDARNSFARAT